MVAVQRYKKSARANLEIGGVIMGSGYEPVVFLTQSPAVLNLRIDSERTLPVALELPALSLVGSR